jgi:hypothetical protein
MIRWSTTTDFAFHFGAIAQVAYLADPSKKVMGMWPFLAIVLLPYVVVLYFQHGELSKKTVRRAHLIATLWYLALSATVSAVAIQGYRPRGWLFFVALMVPGAVISLLSLASAIGGGAHTDPLQP